MVNNQRHVFIGVFNWLIVEAVDLDVDFDVDFDVDVSDYNKQKMKLLRHLI